MILSLVSLKNLTSVSTSYETENPQKSIMFKYRYMPTFSYKKNCDKFLCRQNTGDWARTQRVRHFLRTVRVSADFILLLLRKFLRIKLYVPYTFTVKLPLYQSALLFYYAKNYFPVQRKLGRLVLLLFCVHCV